MPTRVSSIFGSYDLFAKAIPGTVFLLGFLSLLPSKPFKISTSPSATLVAIIIASIFVLGFVFGQALHSVAVRVEAFVYWVTKSYYNTLNALQNIIKNVRENRGNTETADKNSDGESFTKFDALRLAILLSTLVFVVIISDRKIFLIICYLSGIIYGLVSPREKFQSWLSDVLNPHRRLLERKVQSEIQSNSKNNLIYEFENVYKEIFERESPFIDEGNFEETYILVMSHLKYAGIGRARQFQATFSFCRSMWVTFLFYSFIYIFISSSIFIENISSLYPYRPIVFKILGGGDMIMFIGVFLFLSVFPFMEGERQYKSLFNKYVLADFVTSNKERLRSVHSDKR